MKDLMMYLKYRKQIMGLLKYSLEQVEHYKYLTIREKQIIKTEREFKELKELSKYH